MEVTNSTNQIRTSTQNNVKEVMSEEQKLDTTSAVNSKDTVTISEQAATALANEQTNEPEVSARHGGGVYIPPDKGGDKGGPDPEPEP